MNHSFQYELDDELWHAVKQNYESGDYSGAITDSILYLMQLIRDRTGIESDGAKLVGEAFGGSDPPLKVNKLRTKSEKSEQKGFQSILRGIYWTIRNPRAHEIRDDDKKTGDAILVFVSFLVDMINRSKGKFDIDEFCNSTFDKGFVPTKDYADLLVAEVPENRTADVIYELYERRSQADPNTFHHIIDSLMERLSEEEQSAFVQTCSATLRNSNDDQDFRIMAAIFSNERWQLLDQPARMRAEYRMLKSFQEGRYHLDSGKLINGSLGTWLSDIVHNMYLLSRFRQALINKVRSGDDEEIEYLFQYFRYNIIPQEPEPDLIMGLRNRLDQGDKRVYNLVDEEMHFCPSAEWLDEIREAYNCFVDLDDMPF